MQSVISMKKGRRARGATAAAAGIVRHPHQPRALLERVPDLAPIHAILARHSSSSWNDQSRPILIDVTTGSRAEECLPEIRVRFDIVFLPLATVRACVDPIRRNRMITSVLVSPLQQAITGGGIASHPTLSDLLGPVMRAAQEELGLVIACVYLLPQAPPNPNTILLLCFSFDVLPTGAATNEEAPAFCLGWRANTTMADPPPSLCLVPWLEEKGGETTTMPCPRARTWWTSMIPADLQTHPCWSWAGAAFFDPAISALASVPLTHYVPITRKADNDDDDAKHLIEWPSPLEPEERKM